LSSHLVIVEGPSDKGFIEGIAEKIAVKCKVRLMRGNRPEKAARIAKSHFRGAGKAIILKDLHRATRDVTSLINRFKNVIIQLKNEGIELQLIIVKRSIESWVLAGLCVKNSEEISDPEEKLKELMQKKGRCYIKSVETLRKLAKEIDIKKAIEKSESFKKFIKALST